MGTDLLAEIERAIGPIAVMSLERRRLLVAAAAADGTGDGGEVVHDRVRGALVGLAVGRSLSSAAARARRRAPVNADMLRHMALTNRNSSAGAEAQTMEIAARRWANKEWRAAGDVSDAIAADVEDLHNPGRAIVATVERRRQGIPWFESGVPSFGNAALPRAIAVGTVFAGQPSQVSVAAQLDAAVTHAHPIATGAASLTAVIIGALITRQQGVQPADIVRGELSRAASRSDEAASLAKWVLDVVGRPYPTFADAAGAIGTEPTAAVSLALAVLALLPGRDPLVTLSEAVATPGIGRTHAAVIGGLLGAAYGLEALPQQWTTLVDHGDTLRQCAASLHDGAKSPETSGAVGGSSIWFLLDRSGSMASIASDVEGGFDRFFSDQAAAPGDVRVTVVQFDSQNRHEVLVDSMRPADVPTMRGRFVPRGSTPLFDAVAQLLDRAERAGGEDADQLVVIFTDGLENASRRWDRARLFSRISGLQERGWTFVFLGANQDSYSTGSDLGLAVGNVSPFGADHAGVSAAYEGLSRATRQWRAKERAARHVDHEDFWGGHKEAEEELARREHGS